MNQQKQRAPDSPAWKTSCRCAAGNCLIVTQQKQFKNKHNRPGPQIAESSGRSSPGRQGTGMARGALVVPSAHGSVPSLHDAGLFWTAPPLETDHSFYFSCGDPSPGHNRHRPSGTSRTKFRFTGNDTTDPQRAPGCEWWELIFLLNAVCTCRAH